MRRAPERPGWLLLLLWVAVGALFVSPARPAPPSAHDEAPPPALTRAVDEAPDLPDRCDLLVDTPPEEPGPRDLPELVLATDLPGAGPAPRPIVFAHLRRPPPVVVSA